MSARAARPSRQQHAVLIRNRLLRAALKVVARHGYAGASVARITAQAGVAQGTIYSYFESRQQLLDDLLPMEGLKLLGHLAEATRSSQDYFDLERRAFVAVHDYMAAQSHFLRILTEAETAAPDSFALHMRNIEDRYLGALRRAEAAGEVRPQSEAEFRVIAEILSGARGHIAIGFRGAEGSAAKAPRLPNWAADTYVKFIRHGFGMPPDPAEAWTNGGTGGTFAPEPASSTKEALLGAAAQLIHQEGYGGATVKAVTSLAGVAVGTFYTHFGSPRALLEELLGRVRRRMLAHVAGQVRDSTSFAEMECRGFAAFFDYLQHEPGYIRIETEAAVWAPATYHQHFFEIADRYVAAMIANQERGGLQGYERHEFPLLAYFLMAARHYLAARSAPAGASFSSLPPEVAKAYREFVCSGLAA